MVNQVTVIIPQDLRERAKDHRINISALCRDALAIEIRKREQPATAAIRLMYHPVPESVRNGIDNLIQRCDDEEIEVPPCLRDWLDDVDIAELKSWEKQHPGGVL